MKLTLKTADTQIPHRAATNIPDAPPTYGGELFHIETEFGQYARLH
jgi:hypothetical protein